MNSQGSNISSANRFPRSPVFQDYFLALWLALLIGAAIYIRIASGTDLYHLSSDELYFYYMAKGSSLNEVIRYSHSEAHPPLFTIFLHYWLQLSDSIAFLRTLSTIFGVLLIPVFYFLGEQLAGRFAGMMSALLVTFGYGFIVQSYLLRDYTCFLFFLSLSFYFMLRWHSGRSTSVLFAYIMASFLACLSHFTGLAAIFCMCVAEALYLLFKAAPLKITLRWLFANAFIAAAIMPIYYQWESVREFLKNDRPFPPELVHQAYNAPFRALSYMLPMPLNMLLTQITIVLVLLTANKYIRKKLLAGSHTRSLFFPCLLLVICCIVLIGMYLGNITPINFVMDTRHHVWLAPFMLPLIAARFAGYFTYESNKASNAITYKQGKWAVILLLAAFCFYSPYVRSRDGEYMMRETTYQALEGYLKSLDSKHLIMADRNIGFVILPADFNPYQYFDHWQWSDGHIGRMIPLGATHILLDAIDMRFWDGPTLSRFYTAAKAQGQMAGIEDLVFIKNGLWSAGEVNQLINCNSLENKEIKEISSIATEGAFAVITVTIPRQVFENELLNPAGKAHMCLN